MSGTLFVVATPIGNLEDITFRALRVLREVDLVAAEDTRRTAKLFAHYSITTPTLSFHRHNTRSRLPQLIRRLEQGARVAIVTDAGTPGISDPGIDLVQACLTRGIAVDPVPGPSAPLAAAVASGFALEPLTIFGFVPTRSKERRIWMERIRSVEHTFTFFEAPHRVRQTLTELSAVLGDRQISVGREVTKLHQEFLRGKSTEIIGHLTDLRGEFTIVVGPAPPVETTMNRASDLSIFHEFGRSTYIGPGARRRAVTDLARKYGRSAREVYGIIERLKSSGI
jgi:16S rRNA (cytidine1402-2'-O)-methyltransferase